MKAGLAYAAEVIRAEAESEGDIDLAVLCAWTAEAHRPGPDMRCVECGEQWLTAAQVPNLGGLRCQAYAEVVQIKNEWIAGRVQRIAVKYQ